MYRIALLFLALFASASAHGAGSTAVVSIDGLAFNADVNVTGSLSDDRFHFRETSLVAVPISGAAIYNSIEVDAQGTSDGGSGKVDAIWGGCYAPTNTLLNFGSPAAYLIYFTAEAGIDITSLTIDSSFSASAAIVGKVFGKIEEISAAGEVVSTTTLKSRAYSQGDVQSKGPNGELKYITYSSNADGFDVDITFAVSSVLGKLNVGDATITPRNMESFIEIRNYPYGNVANHLRLTVYLGHLAAKASSTFKGTQTIIAGSGKEQIYFKLAGDAVVDGSSVDITVTGLEKSSLQPSDIDNTFFSGTLTASGSLQSEIRKVEIDFPAGAVKISYDPAIGFGAPNAAGLLLPSFGALLLSVAVFFLVL